MLTHQQQNQRISPSANNNSIAYLNHPQKYHTIFWSTNNIIKWYFHQPRQVLEGILVYQKVSWDILIHQQQNVSLHEQQHCRVFESHSVIARCMGKTCGRAVCGGGDSCHSSGTAWRNPFSETTVKQSEKWKGGKKGVQGIRLVQISTAGCLRQPSLSR